MPDVNQQINIIATFQSKLGGMNKAISSLEKMRNANLLNASEFKKEMNLLQQSDPIFFKYAKRMKEEKERQDAINKAKTAAITQSRKMTGAYLSLMFTGMALTRVFGGLVKSVLDVLGVGDMLNATILVVLLPALEPLADILYTIMDFFMNLPEPVQKIIGGLVLFAAIAGVIMTVWGAVGTFLIGGFQMISGAVSGLWGIISAFVGWVATALGVSFGAAFAIIVGIIAAVVAIVVGAIEAWKNNFLGFKDAVVGIWEAIKTVIGGFVSYFKGIWDIISGIFTLNWDKIKQGFSLVGEGIKNIFRGIANFIINIINALVSLVLSALAQIVRPIQWIWNKIPGVNKVSWYEDIMSAGAGKGLIPSFATGGVMPHTGLAMLHAGETITPAGQNINSSPVFNINASISSDYDVKRLADQLSKYWTNDYARITKARGLQ